VNPFSIILLDAKVNVCRIFQESVGADAKMSLFATEVTVSSTQGM
jgi:hypothetical protein